MIPLTGRDLRPFAHFTGREWLIKQIDNFISTRHHGYVIVQAEAGVGKSSLAAHLVQLSTGRGFITFHACPEAVRRKLREKAWQLN